MLNSFIRQVAKYRFLVDAQEFDVFVQFTGDRLLQAKKSMSKEAPLQKLDKYQAVCPIDLKSIGPEQKLRCKNTIEKFNKFINACLMSMKTRKKTHEDLARRWEL